MQQPDPSDESVPCFIRKTYKILEDNEHSDIISWNPDGTAIIIKNPTEFAQTILPVYFKHNNINSFIRQLNMYDFHKKKTPDGEHVYYHELFQRGKKNLLKNIRRKNAESSVLNTEKSRLGLELVKTKQDIAAIINENLFLKKVQNESLSTIQNLEAKINELTIQNQALWAQLLKYSDKQDTVNSFLPIMKRDPLAPLSNVDPNVKCPLLSLFKSYQSRDNILNQIAQTTTITPQFPLDPLTSKNWNLTSENFAGANLSGFYPQNLGNENQAKIVSNAPLKDQNYLESDYTSDLSQQIVRNMDQELQYLKKLTSSSNRPAADTSLSNSPNSELLGKRIFGTDLGYQNVHPYENLSKIYRPENYLGLNLLTNPGSVEGRKGFGGEYY